MFILVVIYALPLGVLQSYSRSYFSNIIPPGYESQFFSMFEVTNKGSSIFSPIVVSQVVAHASFRYVFVYILVLTLIPAILLLPLDPRLAHEQAMAYSVVHPRSENTYDTQAMENPSTQPTAAAIENGASGHGTGPVQNDSVDTTSADRVGTTEVLIVASCV